MEKVFIKIILGGVAIFIVDKISYYNFYWLISNSSAEAAFRVLRIIMKKRFKNEDKDVAINSYFDNLPAKEKNKSGPRLMIKCMEKDADYLIYALDEKEWSNQLLKKLKQIGYGKETNGNEKIHVVNKNTANIQNNTFNIFEDSAPNTKSDNKSQKDFVEDKFIGEPTLKDKILYHVKFLFESNQHQQCIRYGHYFIQLGLMNPSSSFAKTRLKEWKELLGEIIEIPANVMNATSLMTDPFRIYGVNWTVDNTIPNIIEILRFFEDINCNEGVKKVLVDVNSNLELGAEFNKRYPNYSY